jgi:hypothetical protein
MGENGKPNTSAHTFPDSANDPPTARLTPFRKSRLVIDRFIPNSVSRFTSSTGLSSIFSRSNTSQSLAAGTVYLRRKLSPRRQKKEAISDLPDQRSTHSDAQRAKITPVI